MAALFGAFGGLIAPNVVGLFIKSGATSEWQLVLFTTAAVNLLAGIVFLVAGSGQSFTLFLFLQL